MNDRDIRRYDRATRVVTFGQSNDTDFAPDSLARGHFAAITTKIDDIALAKAGQMPDRVSKETLLDAVMLDLQRIAATARSIENRAGRLAFRRLTPCRIARRSPSRRRRTKPSACSKIKLTTLPRRRPRCDRRRYRAQSDRSAGRRGKHRADRKTARGDQRRGGLPRHDRGQQIPASAGKTAGVGQRQPRRTRARAEQEGQAGQRRRTGTAPAKPLASASIRVGLGNILSFGIFDPEFHLEAMC